MEYVNLTPHDINIDGRVIKQSGMVVRLVDNEVTTHMHDGIMHVILESDTNNIILPQKKDGTILLVSRAVASVVRREDVYFPFDLVRDRNGNIFECKKLARYELL